ncbi:MAG TPA: phosphate acyltransferase PlsX [Leptolinea sp.]
MTLVLDAMGSDQYPDPEIRAAIDCSNEFGEEILLVGNEEILKPKLAAANPGKSRIRLVHAPDILEMWDKPVENAKKKPLNSMAVGLNLLKTGEGQAFVSAGNTGGVMFNALRILGRLPGVQRPALTALFPVIGGHCVVLDIGANADCRPEFLVQFAVMGSIYAQKTLGIATPRVGLLSNGEEAGKGNQLIKDTYHLLENCGVNYIGNVEAKELFGGQTDVVVTDGFTGNVLLKTSEAVARMITDTLKTELMSSFQTKLGGMLAKPAFGAIRKMMDPGETGAAPLLGVDGLVFVGHGRSDAHAMISALHVAHQSVQADLLASLRSAVQEQLAQLPTPEVSA